MSIDVVVVDIETQVSSESESSSSSSSDYDSSCNDLTASTEVGSLPSTSPPPPPQPLDIPRIQVQSPDSTPTSRQIAALAESSQLIDYLSESGANCDDEDESSYTRFTRNGLSITDVNDDDDEDKVSC